MEPIAEQASDLFYGRLFEIAPDVEPLFANATMEEQKKKLMQTLGVAVAGLDNLDELTPALRALGERHVDYDVKNEHYQSVGAAFLWTLEQGLGDAYTEEVKEAWTVVYTTLAETMIKAADEKLASQ